MGRTKQPEILSQQWLYHSRLFHVEGLRLRFSNGVERDYERLNPQQGTANLPRAVMMVPLLDAETVLLVREFGAGLGQYYLSLPKGAIHQGEHLLDTAQRELKEEIGFGARRLEALKTLSLSPSYMGNQLSVVLAQDLFEERLPGDEPEPLEVVPWPLAELDTLLAGDEFSEAYAVAALLLARAHLAWQSGTGS